jgi:hypothetical protein
MTEFLAVVALACALIALGIAIYVAFVSLPPR